MIREPQLERAAVRVRLWDLPTRLFHWSLVASVSTALVTGYLGGNLMSLHGQAGLAILGLLAFRIIWGFVGSQPSRFASFAPTPERIRRYLRGQWHGLGHNPLGALSVFAMLGLLAAQVGTGLFATDDIAFTGPLQALVNDELSLRLTGIHHQLATGLLAVLGLHVAAILFYVKVKKENLVKPMVTGWKELPVPHAAHVAGDAAIHASARTRRWAFALALLLGIGSAVAVEGIGEKEASNNAPAPAPASAKPATPAW